MIPIYINFELLLPLYKTSHLILTYIITVDLLPTLVNFNCRYVSILIGILIPHVDYHLPTWCPYGEQLMSMWGTVVPMSEPANAHVGNSGGNVGNSGAHVGAR